MCNFYSAIVDKKGKVYDRLGVDEHRRLEEIYGLRDNGLVERCKIECVPVKGIDSPIGSWEFVVDEARMPEWWNAGYEQIVRNHIKKNVIKHYCRKTQKGYIQIMWYDNGQKWYETPYVNGQVHGKEMGWYVNGQKGYEVSYVNGQKHGEAMRWYGNGQKWYDVAHANGQLHGTEMCWYPNGQKCYEREYVNGRQHGKQIGWHENGQKSYEAPYVNGQLHGKLISWYEGGQKYREALYVNGKEGYHAEW